MTNKLKQLAERMGYEVIYTESGKLAKYDDKMCVRKDGELLAYDPANNPKQCYELQNDFKIELQWDGDEKEWLAMSCTGIEMAAIGKTLGEAVTACAIEIMKGESDGN